MMNLSLDRLEAIAVLSERREYAVMLDWLRDETDKRIREAIATADPRACGAAAMLQDLTDTLRNVRSIYDRTRKTESGSGIT